MADLTRFTKAARVTMWRIEMLWKSKDEFDTAIQAIREVQFFRRTHADGDRFYDELALIVDDLIASDRAADVQPGLLANIAVALRKSYR